ncbi:MAG TPA: Fic family protein [Solirubrobacterales bacterium]|nr:Fic family protein [Solirubrobacterales bacterium]
MDSARYPKSRFGQARRTPGRHGYVAYFPASIPRTLELPGSTVKLLAEAEGSLGQLAAVGRLIPNPDLLLRPYLLREAVSSTRIEGTQATIGEVLDTDASGGGLNPDVEEVVNYVLAMRWGLQAMERLPLSTRLLREMHAHLMAGVRGRELSPGKLRTSQNWIGPPGSTVASAPFVPPPPDELGGLLGDWERFAHEEPEMPVLVQNALLHAQFEAIHPFLDGNGRLGRLLLVFFLIARGRLPAPLLYLSTFLERHRSAYYESLQAVQEKGDVIPWVDLFLNAIRTQASDAIGRSQRILELRDSYREVATTLGTANALPLVDLICENPVLTTGSIEGRLDVSRPTALRLLRRMEEAGVLTEREAGARGQRRYVATDLLAAVTEDSA